MSAISRLRGCSAGAVAVITAMTLPLLLGFVSLGTEVGHWYLAQREMQGAADAAAISAAAEYIQQYNGGNPASTSYQTVGRSYALLNGFSTPTSNICLVTASGPNAGCTAQSVDTRPIICSAPPCIVAEVTQNTANWLTTRASVRPLGSHIAAVQPIPTPTLVERAVVAIGTALSSTSGGDCVLALANDPQALWVHGQGDLKANCGIAADGGIDQNVSGTPLGGLTFSGSNAKVETTTLTVAATTAACPSSQCFLYTPAGTAMPASAVHKHTATLDPYAATLNFPKAPLGVQTGGVAIVNKGSGYTNGTCTFTVTGGTFYGGTSTPAKFTATISGNKVNSITAVTDPGAYASPSGFPTSPVTATSSCGGSGATFTLTQGCFSWTGTPIAGRKYCSINANNGTVNFPAGNYYIAGGDSGNNCPGFCVQGGSANVTSAAAGVTFYLMKGDGANSRGPTYYATVNIHGMGNSGSLAICAPGTVASGTLCGNPSNNSCTGNCFLFVSDPTATANGLSTSQGTPIASVNVFNGNSNTTLGGLAYLPTETFQSGGNTNILGCFGLIAKYVDVGGTPTFSDGCLPGNGVGSTTTTSLTSPSLVQ